LIIKIIDLWQIMIIKDKIGGLIICKIEIMDINDEKGG
jgi:hypothetical protein